jgi:hypothetical protein
VDREIRQVEDRLALLTRRLEDQKRAPPPVSRRSLPAAVPPAEQKLRRDIEDLQLKLKQLHAERLDAYNSARKAGLLPGEIDGRGITP